MHLNFCTPTPARKPGPQPPRAASAIAMAGTKVIMAPTALLMIHNPSTTAMGDHRDMQKAIELLDQVKESIINAYEIKTGMSRITLSHLMDAETWMNANKAIELKFADEILEDDKKKSSDVSFAFSAHEFATNLLNKIASKESTEPIKTGRKVSELKNELAKIKKLI